MLVESKFVPRSTYVQLLVTNAANLLFDEFLFYLREGEPSYSLEKLLIANALCKTELDPTDLVRELMDTTIACPLVLRYYR